MAEGVVLDCELKEKQKQAKVLHRREFNGEQDE